MPRRPSGKRITLSDGTVQVRGKNANGDGSAYAFPNGTWRATWYDRTGKIRYVRGRTRAAALEKRAALIAEDQAGSASTVFNKNTTVAELAAWWLDNVASQRVRRSSLGKYRDRVA